MSCLYPMQAWQIPASKSSTGKAVIVFQEQVGSLWEHLTLPCGGCATCRLERSRQWAMRCVHEAQMYERNCFITLTFDDDHLDDRVRPFSLDKREFQLFMKRFRKKFGNGIRYYHCGEYGELSGRPHYHACIFNFDFPDRVFYSCKNGVNLYSSELLSSLWPYGFCSVGDVTFESAAYVARYIMKKINGDLKEKLVDVFDPISETVYSKRHYEFIDFSTGECYERIPEYTTMSRRPGIGRSFLDKYTSDIYDFDFVVFPGRGKMRPPKYYDSVYEFYDPDSMRNLKDIRISNAGKHWEDQTPQRLAVKEKVVNARLSILKRSL